MGGGVHGSNREEQRRGFLLFGLFGFCLISPDRKDVGRVVVGIASHTSDRRPNFEAQVLVCFRY